MEDLIEMIETFRNYSLDPDLRKKTLLEIAIQKIYNPALIPDFWNQYVERMSPRYTEKQCYKRLEGLLQGLAKDEDNKGKIWLWRQNTRPA